MGYFKQISNFKNFAYVTFGNNKKKSKYNLKKRMSYQSIKLDIINKEDKLMDLHKLT